MAILSGNSVNTFPTPAASTTPASSSASSSTPVTTTSSTATDQKSLDSTYSQFLSMLTTQLKYQDPLSPMDTSQFTQQLVSFSQVEQQLKTNSYLAQMASSANTNQTALGLYYIGLNVDVQGSAFGYSGTGGVNMSYNLPAASANTQISILDQNNKVVYSTTGATTAGNNSFAWNGLDNNGNPVPAGVYQIQVGAVDTKNASISGITTTVPGKVTGIQTQSDGSVDLIVNGQDVPMSSVTKATSS